MAKTAESEAPPEEPTQETPPADEIQPVEEQPKETEAPTEPQPEPQEAEPSFMDRLKETGFEFSEGDDESSAQGRLLEAYEQQVARQQQYDRQLQQQEQELAAYRVQLHQAQQTAAPRQQTAAQESLSSQPGGPAWPQFAEPDLHQVQKYRTLDNETGQYGWAPETPPAVRAAAEQYQAEVESWQNLIAYQPQEFRQLVESVAQEQIINTLKDQWGFEPKELPQRLDINGEQAYVKSVFDRYETVLFEKDPRTQQVDYNRLTAIGSQFRQALQEAQDMGIPTEAGQYRYAERVMGQSFAAVETEAENVSARQSAEEKKRQHLRNAAAKSQQRTGSVPQDREEDIESPQNPNISAGEDTAGRLKESGFFESFAKTPADAAV